MKSKPRSRQAQPDLQSAPQPSAFERKMKAVGLKIRSNPSIIAGTIVIAYCIYRVLFEV